MVKKTVISEEDVWRALDRVKDPEIPVISVVEMGIVRAISLDEDKAKVKMTPTFSGCPALDVIRTDIQNALFALGLAEVYVETVLHPPWTSDWIDPNGRKKLKAFGVTPPHIHRGRLEITFYEPVACPYCDSFETSIRNNFGPTLCRAIYYCNSCQQPFEQFKAL